MSSAKKEVDGRKQRASLRRSKRREAILQAAKKIFSVKGYHACSIADILEEAGVARGTFYLYFPSKRTIFEALLEEMFTQIAGAVRRIELGPRAEAPLVQMQKNVLRVITVLEGNRELTIILLREAVGLDADFDLKLDTFYQRLSSMIEGGLKLGQEMGLVRSCDTRLVSYCVLGSLKEVMLRMLTGGGWPGMGNESLAEELLQYNLQGVFL